MADLIGKTLGQYRIVRELGRGGMAIVYEAYQPALNRTVAIKVLPPGLSADATFVQRFLREARAVARLEHPNIVAIYDVQDFGGIYGIVMQKLAGVPLDTLVQRNGRLPRDRAAHILGQIASALDYAHSCGIVHRDVKPANIMVGPGDRAWLTDFGLAQAATGTQPTQTRTFAGTPKYMSPEQANGQPVAPLVTSTHWGSCCTTCSRAERHSRLKQRTRSCTSKSMRRPHRFVRLPRNYQQRSNQSWQERWPRIRRNDSLAPRP
jgi:serine/threonine-protein kinase